MRGSPLWQLLAVLVAFLAMGLPVWRLTRPAEAAPVDVTAGSKERSEQHAQAAAALTMDVAASFAPVPTEFSLSYLGTPVLQGKAEAKATGGVKTPIPAEGVDLVLHVVWTTGGEQTVAPGPAAARVVIQLSDGRQVEKSFWSEDGSPLDTVLSVPGKAVESAAP